MTRKPYGKYDHLTPDERESLRQKTQIQSLATGVVVFALFAVDRYFGPFTSLVNLGLNVATLAAMARVIQLMVRSIMIMSPNPPRKPNDDAPPSTP